MKKGFLITLVLVLCASVSTFASSKYRVDEAAIDQVFESSINVMTIESEVDMMDLTSVTSIKAEKNVWIAVVLDFFLGGLAIHRVYLGGTPVLILGYFITFFGVFGLIPLIDLIILVINNEDISKYVDNNAFLMW